MRKALKPCGFKAFLWNGRTIWKDVSSSSIENPAKRFSVESEEKARPAYEKALRRFHRLRAFAELESPDNLDILF